MTFAQKILCVCLLVLSPTVYANPRVCMETNIGSFCIELLETTAPGTVANFIHYVNDGDYIDSIFHRSSPGFVVQGGGFIITDELFVNAVPTDAPISNEFSAANLRGTVAMAKLDGDPNSATSQWFVNLADNSENLDAQNGGFTVFGKISDQNMHIFDTIATLPRGDFGPSIAGGAMRQTPLTDFSSGDTVKLENFIRISGATIIPSGSLDIDKSGSADALSDGLIIICFLFGFTGETLINGAVSNACTVCSADAIATQLAQIQAIFDVDDNGQLDALGDGLIIIRYLFGFQGDALITGAVANNCQRCSSVDIQAYLDSL